MCAIYPAEGFPVSALIPPPVFTGARKMPFIPVFSLDRTAPRSPLKEIIFNQRTQVKRVLALKQDETLGKFFTSTYKSLLPLPTTRGPKLILWRGCNQDQLMNMVRTGSAGGKTEPNPGALRPTEKEAIAQVGEFGHLPEFTHSTEVAIQFGTGGFVCAFEIDMGYLTKGSGSEGGWICANDAPVKLVGWSEGREFVNSARIDKEALLRSKINLINEKNAQLRAGAKANARAKIFSPKPFTPKPIPVF